MVWPRRNHLVWLSEAAWARLADDPGLDDIDRAIVTLWQARQLPLVVARPCQTLPADRVALGLPAPERWERRRLGVNVAVDEIARLGRFPSLLQVARTPGCDGAALELGHALERLGLATQVYGSHGWELLTGESYLRPASDLDLSVEVPDFEVACTVATLLEAARLPRRLDGELVLADGSAVAWREFAQLAAGRVDRALVKRLDGVALADLGELRRRAESSAVPA